MIIKNIIVLFIFLGIFIMFLLNYFAHEKENIELGRFSIIGLSIILAIGAIFLAIDDNKLDKQYKECKKIEEQITKQQEIVSDIELTLKIKKETKNEIEEGIKENYNYELKKLNDYIKEYNNKASKYNSDKDKNYDSLKLYDYKVCID